ncbi:MAG: ArgE/DapE family deacylase [Gemmatimonadota bacterium]
MTPPKGDAVALVRELVRIDSRNPSLADGAPGEQRVANALAQVLRSWGLPADIVDVMPGRPNVIAVIHGSGGGRSLMFNGHIDVVGVEGMTHAPFDAFERDGRIYGRGASDMKGGVAAMCAAAAKVNGRLKGDLIIAAVADEEWRSAGTSALLANGLRADAAIVTEPTRLRIMPAHKGFAWIEVRVSGKAAHGSRWDIGVDAIRHAGLLLAELDRVDSEDLPRRSHALLGRPSLHASEVAGGLGISTYPDRCVVKLERRTIPGETPDEARREVETACERVRVRRPEFRAEVELLFAQPSSDVAVDAPVVRTLADALRSHRLPTDPAGMSAWTDAALLNAAGIQAICFGPGDMGLAHAAEEYIESREVEQAANVLESFALAWCN